MKEETKIELVKPVAYAKEKGIRPQMIFSWIRSGSIKVREFNPKTGRGWLVSRTDLDNRFAQYVNGAQERLDRVQQYTV